MSSGGIMDFLIGIPWFAWIPIIAIICGAITKVVSMSHEHSERLEMIRQGMDPDKLKSRSPEL